MTKLNPGLVLISFLVAVAFGFTDNNVDNANAKVSKDSTWRFPFARSSDASAIELGDVSEASKKLDTIKAMVDDRKQKRKQRNKAEKDRRRSRQEPSLVSMDADEQMQDAGKSFLEALGLEGFHKSTPSDEEGTVAHNLAIEDLKFRVMHQLAMDPNQIPQDLVHFEKVVGGKLVLENPSLAAVVKDDEVAEDDAAAKEQLLAEGFVLYDQVDSLDSLPAEFEDKNEEIDDKSTMQSVT
ncbi:hypothetical protein MHU86_18118 [Fragilaria crotonensis]|nr:hypothetical protein MHU86_18118 [Fragilaria crotonensis]